MALCHVSVHDEFVLHCHAQPIKMLPTRGLAAASDAGHRSCRTLADTDQGDVGTDIQQARAGRSSGQVGDERVKHKTMMNAVH